MENSSVLYEKNDTKIIKLDNGTYNLFFSIENNKMNLDSIINFDLIKLIYDLNTDICEKVILEKYDENTANISILIKNLFADLGLPQKYSCLQITKSIQNSQNVFDFTIIVPTKKPEWLTNDMEVANIKSIKLISDAVSTNQHKIKFKCLIDFQENIDTPIFIQKVSVMVINKIINRLKQFIENVRV
jgi:hypothetical protein